MLLLPVPIDGLYGAIGHAIWDCGHIVLGGGLAAAFWQIPLWRNASGGRRTAAVLLLVTLLAALFEVLQLTVGRSSSVKDVLSTLAGALLWSWMSGTIKPASTMHKGLLAVGLTGLMWVPLGPLGWAVYVSVDAGLRLPSLADFSTPGYRGQWDYPDQDRVPSVLFPGRKALTITVPALDPDNPPPPPYSIIRFNEFPADWSAYSTLEILLSAEQPVRISFSLGDQYYRSLRSYQPEDRFGMILDLKPGLNTYRFDNKDWTQTPGGRKMDDTEMRQLHFVVKRTTVDQHFTVERVRLYP